jgi:hypothetical protein
MRKLFILSAIAFATAAMATEKPPVKPTGEYHTIKGDYSTPATPKMQNISPTGIGQASSNSTSGSNSVSKSLSAAAASASGGNVYQESAAAPSLAIAPVQVRNCRIGIGGSGATRDGSAAFAIPLGNDQLCLSGGLMDMMQQVNLMSAQMGQNPPFRREDFMKIACKIEGMAETEGCKAAGETAQVVKQFQQYGQEAGR